jgi:hypothetical protein
MKKDFIRLLKPNEIECRTATINAKGLSLLLYKDARVDQRILDETFGAFGWKRSHQCIDGNLYCTVEIYNRESGEWVSKQDVGTTGYTEKEKSQASDSFKRACFNWGIGRELYSAPFIWIPADKTFIQMKEGQNREKRYYCNDHFSVYSIQYNDEKEIQSLVIIDNMAQPVFEWKSAQSVERNGNTGKAADKKELVEVSISKNQMDSLQAELVRTGVTIENVKDRYKIQNLGDMNEELYGKVMLALSRTKSVHVA